MSNVEQHKPVLLMNVPENRLVTLYPLQTFNFLFDGIITA